MAIHPLADVAPVMVKTFIAGERRSERFSLGGLVCILERGWASSTACNVTVSIENVLYYKGRGKSFGTITHHIRWDKQDDDTAQLVTIIEDMARDWSGFVWHINEEE